MTQNIKFIVFYKTKISELVNENVIEKEAEMKNVSFVFYL